MDTNRLTMSVGVVCTANVSLNAYTGLRQMSYGDSASYLNFHEDTTSVIEKAKALTGNSVSRIEKDYLYTFNDAMNFSYPSITHYSSNLKTNLVNFLIKQDINQTVYILATVREIPSHLTVFTILNTLSQRINIFFTVSKSL